MTDDPKLPDDVPDGDIGASEPEDDGSTEEENEDG